MTGHFAITPARRDDAPGLAELYAHHVLHGTATFETVPPDAAEFEARLDRVLGAGWPWLVARAEDGAVLGYAYATQFRDRPAYAFAAENSIYIRHDQRGRGIGTALLRELIGRCESFGFRQIMAVIGGGEPASIALHAACGFVHRGRMEAMGRKHGRWLDTVYMQLALGPGAETPPAQEPQ